MKRKTCRILSSMFMVAFFIIVNSLLVSATEHANADMYRKILSSGKFCIEYELIPYDGNVFMGSLRTNGRRLLAFDGDKRISYATGAFHVGNRMAMRNNGKFKDWQKEAMRRGDTLMPEVMYQNKKYYQFFGNRAIVASEEELESDTVNSHEMWNMAKEAVLIPEALSAFLPNSHLVSKFMVGGDDINFGVQSQYSSVYEGSKKESLLGEELTCDEYKIKLIFTVNGENQTRDMKVCKLYYDSNGVLKYGETMIVVAYDDATTIYGGLPRGMAQSMKKHSPSSLRQFICFEKISNSLPEHIFAFPKGCEVYSMDKGNMNDVLGEPVLVEKY